uniref:Uncharacterized protein n=2 Tax=Cacopsylla melanoneura TaxID=428564 RepID=A0A8D9E936_9HEMI
MAFNGDLGTNHTSLMLLMGTTYLVPTYQLLISDVYLQISPLLCIQVCSIKIYLYRERREIFQILLKRIWDLNPMFIIIILLLLQRLSRSPMSTMDNDQGSFKYLVFFVLSIFEFDR